MKKRNHSLSVLVCLLSFCLGLIIFSFSLFHVNIYWFFTAIILLAILSWRLIKFWRLLAFGLLFLVLGLFYCFLSKPIITPLQGPITGAVSGFRSCDQNECSCPIKVSNELVMVTISQNQDFLCVSGKTLKITGILSVPKYKSQTLGKGIAYQIKATQVKLISEKTNWWILFLRFLLLVRQSFDQALDKLYGYSEAVFAKGLILGEKQNLTKDFVQNLQNTGTSHLVALSGFNISILIFALFTTFALISPRFAFGVTSISILGFILMTGAPTSVVRAGIVGEFLLLATIIGRQSDSGLILVWSLFFIGLLAPFSLAYDISLQLSFAAFLGIVYLAPLVSEKLKSLGFVSSILGQTIGAILFTLPFIAYYFGRISLIAILPNILVVSVLPFVSYLIILSGIFYFFALPIAKFLSFITQIFLDYMLWVINFFGKLSFAGLGLKINSAIWFLPYYLILVLILIFWWQNKYRQQSSQS
jgi:ComEC/Rec2-related protein